MLNYIWLGLILIGVVVAGLFGRIGGEDGIIEAAFNMAETAVFGIILPMMGFWMMWLGFMRLAEKAGMIDAVAVFLRPVMKRLFPDVPENSPAMGAMIMNMAANMLGLGNSATPFGLKAMQHLEELNPHKGTATNAMCTFLAINTSSVTLIPATAIGYLASSGIANPYAIVGTAIFATGCSTIVAIVAVKLFERMPMFRIRDSVPTAVPPDSKPDVPVEKDKDDVVVQSLPPISRFGKIAIVTMFSVLAVVAVFETWPDQRESFLKTIGLSGLVEGTTERVGEAWPMWRRTINTVSIMAIPFVFVLFTGIAALRRVSVYEEFVEGAKEGFHVAVRVMPFLVAMLVALGIFRASGALELLQRLLAPVLNAVGFDTELLPMALIRPLSGGGSMGVLNDILANPGIPDAVKYTAGTMFGSTETTFYVLAVYFGSVAIRRTRHALAAGLCADLAGVIAAIVICRAVFGA